MRIKKKDVTNWIGSTTYEHSDKTKAEKKAGRKFSPILGLAWANGLKWGRKYPDAPDLPPNKVVVPVRMEQDGDGKWWYSNDKDRIPAGVGLSAHVEADIIRAAVNESLKRATGHG